MYTVGLSYMKLFCFSTASTTDEIHFHQYSSTFYTIHCTAHIAIYLKKRTRKFCWQPPRSTRIPRARSEGHEYRLMDARSTRAFTVKHPNFCSFKFLFSIARSVKYTLVDIGLFLKCLSESSFRHHEANV